MPETLAEKLDTLKNLFEQIKEGVYSGGPILSNNDRLLAYSEFEARALLLKHNYTKLPEKEAQPLLTQLKDLQREFTTYGIETAEKRYNQSLALNLARQQLELSQPKYTEDTIFSWMGVPMNGPDAIRRRQLFPEEECNPHRDH